MASQILPGQVRHQSDGGKSINLSAKGMNFKGLMPSNNVEDDPYQYQKDPVHCSYRESSGDKSFWLSKPELDTSSLKNNEEFKESNYTHSSSEKTEQVEHQYVQMVKIHDDQNKFKMERLEDS